MPTKDCKTVNIKEQIVKDVVMYFSNKYHITKTVVLEQALLDSRKEKEEKG